MFPLSSSRICSIAIGLLASPECDIRSGLEVPDRNPMWNQVIQRILATDMAKHFRHVCDVNRLSQTLYID
jgi:hypothetical protein